MVEWHLDTNKDGSYEHLYNEDLIALGLACTTTFSYTYRRFECLCEESGARAFGVLVPTSGRKCLPLIM